jgi:hypothetical protein
MLNHRDWVPRIEDGLPRLWRFPSDERGVRRRTAATAEMMFLIEDDASQLSGLANFVSQNSVIMRSPIFKQAHLFWQEKREHGSARVGGYHGTFVSENNRVPDRRNCPVLRLFSLRG